MKKGLSHVMLLAKHNPLYDTKYAAVTFASSATVNFKFLPWPYAARKIMTIPYPDGATNTQAGLEEARKLFVNPSSGTVLGIQCKAISTGWKMSVISLYSNLTNSPSENQSIKADGGYWYRCRPSNYVD